MLASVSAAAGNDIWAVGSSSVDGATPVPLIERWNGAAWEQVASPPGNGALSGVVALSADDAWAVGGNSSGTGSPTLIEHWDGTSWSVVPSPNAPGGYLNSVAGRSASSVWAVGYQDAGHKTLAEYWDGVDWRIVTTPSPGPKTNALTGVVDLSAADGWAVGSSGGTTGSTLAEHWNGARWKVVATPNTASDSNMLNGVAASTARCLGCRHIPRPAQSGEHGGKLERPGVGYHHQTETEEVKPCLRHDSPAQRFSVEPRQGGARQQELLAGFLRTYLPGTGHGLRVRALFGVGSRLHKVAWIASTLNHSDRAVMSSTGLVLQRRAVIVPGVAA